MVWDFDGVIKESLAVKAAAFAELFAPFGGDLSTRVRRHHDEHGGLSRLAKVPLYLTWAGLEPTPERVAEYCSRFGDLVRAGVIDSAWVPGVEAYLRGNPYGQAFVVASATPQRELEEILDALAMAPAFAAVFGAPTTKPDAVRAALRQHAVGVAGAVVVGDARADMDAAAACGVAFVLRRHETNASLFDAYDGPAVEDFSNL